MKTSIIRPGLLVALKTTVTGGVIYTKVDLEADHEVESGVRVARWETTRETTDADEHQAAIVARGQIRSLIASKCCNSAFGLLCPEDAKDDLDAAIADARKIADAHNERAQVTRVEFRVLAGRIAQSDEQAAAAIASEVRDLLGDMEASVRRADPKAIRDAASAARKLSGMLNTDAAAKVSAAIDEVRKVAREIVRRVEKAGETAASVVDSIQLDAIENARFSVLDIESSDEQMIAIEVQAPAIDLAPIEDPNPTRETIQAPTLNIDWE